MSEPLHFICPNCGHEITTPQDACPYCGAPLGLAAAAASADLLTRLAQLTEPPASTEVLVPRLGEVLVAQGKITEKQLQQALAYQARQRREGRHVRLGQVLIELGYLDPEALDQAIAEQIWRLHQSMQEANQRLLAQVQERTAELRSALERIQELNHIKANFVARISHELRTPLTHLIGYLDLLEQEHFGSLTEDQREALQAMRRATNRLRQLVEDLIRFALLSRGELSLNIQPVAVTYLCQKALEAIWPRAYAKGVQVQQRCPDQAWLVRADGEKIIWALQHLLDNAVKFTPRGGQVRFEARRVESGEALVEFRIADTGPGIPQERLAEIFEPFHQLEEAAIRRHQGLGLGLALVRQVLDAHGVTLHIESQPGRGTQAFFRLPLLAS